MDAFVSRKRKRPGVTQGEPASSTTLLTHDSQEDDEESTDFKLALLSSMHPECGQDVLLDMLLSHDGSVEQASALISSANSPLDRATSRRTIGFQSSLSGYVSSTAPYKKHQPVKKGRTLHLYSPEDVAALTPCSIIHNFLPADQANALLSELLVEASTFERNTFKLFDRVVQSPCTACFYVEDLAEHKKNEKHYVYDGMDLSTIREHTPELRRASPLVRAAVNIEVAKRIQTHYPDGKKLPFQSPDPWTTNAALVNCYAGGHESLGFHSDTLTYVGPRPVIGSLSLGVAREFRVKRIIPRDTSEDSSETAPDAPPPSQPATSTKPGPASTLLDATDNDGGQIAIHLPHNSLLVMHAEMQEEWKHAIAPSPVIDPHPLAGPRRINITYRDYKAALHPRHTPRCRCGRPTVLRAVQRRRASHGRYYWSCQMGYVEGHEKCDFFAWQAFTVDGVPVWPDSEGEGEGEGKKEVKVDSLDAVVADAKAGESREDAAGHGTACTAEASEEVVHGPEETDLKEEVIP